MILKMIVILLPHNSINHNNCFAQADTFASWLYIHILVCKLKLVYVSHFSVCILCCFTHTVRDQGLNNSEALKYMLLVVVLFTHLPLQGHCLQIQYITYHLQGRLFTTMQKWSLSLHSPSTTTTAH